MTKLLLITIIAGCFNKFYASKDSLRYSSLFEKFEFSVSLADLELEFKSASLDNSKSYERLFDSIKDNSITYIKDTAFWKYGSSIEFEHILVKLLRKEKIDFYFETKKLNPSQVKIKKKYIKCCISYVDFKSNKITVKRKRSACSKAIVFIYNNRIEGTLTITDYRRIISCI